MEKGVVAMHLAARIQTMLIPTYSVVVGVQMISWMVMRLTITFSSLTTSLPFM
jgi:hypothetical protein